MRALRTLSLLAGLVAGAADAARLESVAVAHADGRFTVEAVMRIEAPAAAVRAALTDFANLTRLSPAILESRVLQVEAGATLVYTRQRACAGWFCRQVRKTERVTVSAAAIHAVLATGPGAERGNLVASDTVWRIEAAGAATRVALSSTMDPAFFVPPFIGPPIIKSALKRETEQLARGLERVALTLPAAGGADGG